MRGPPWARGRGPGVDTEAVRPNSESDFDTGEHLWSGRYDRELQEIFALQDEITRKIVTELDVKLVGGEDTRVWR